MAIAQAEVAQTQSGGASDARSFCRTCGAHCGVIISLDETGRLASVRGDKEDDHSLGFVCAKGTSAPEWHNGAARLLHPLKRMPDGSFARITLEQAYDEIADQVRVILDRDGPEAIAGFRGTGGYLAAASTMMIADFVKAVGSHKMFSTLTIDQSAKMVSIGRLGWWPPGHQAFADSDVILLIGGNPMVSLVGLDSRHPAKRMKAAKARGLKLLLIDPRRTETAAYADHFLQPLPGEDATIAAGMLRLVLAEGWEDKAFCAQHVGDLAVLREAVDSFTPDYVARRADVPAEDFRAMTAAFAREGKRGIARTATGPDMSPRSNLTEHLVECLNVICGRYIREGEPIPNPGFLTPRFPRPAHVVPPQRPWEQGPKSRIGGFGTMLGEMMTGILPDEILEPGPGQVKFLINQGGNIASNVPDQNKVVRALRQLDLLVSIEPFMTATARLSHYILPPKLQYERNDLTHWQFETALLPEPWTRYTPQIVPPPEGSEVCDEWMVFWALAQRLGLDFDFLGVPLDMTVPPTEDELLAIVARHSVVPYEELKQQTRGCFDHTPQFAAPADPAEAGRFVTMPQDVRAEIAELAGEHFDVAAAFSSGQRFTHRLASRRLRNRFNSQGADVPGLKRLSPYNFAYINPADLGERGVASGDFIEISSDAGSIVAIADADQTVRRGVVSMSHGFGGLPEDKDYRVNGSVTNQLISLDRDCQTINAMPRMSGIPVNFRPVEPTLPAT